MLTIIKLISKPSLEDFASNIISDAFISQKYFLQKWFSKSFQVNFIGSQSYWIINRSHFHRFGQYLSVHMDFLVHNLCTLSYGPELRAKVVVIDWSVMLYFMNDQKQNLSMFMRYGRNNRCSRWIYVCTYCSTRYRFDSWVRAARTRTKVTDQ